MSDQILTNTH